MYSAVLYPTDYCTVEEVFMWQKIITELLLFFLRSAAVFTPREEYTAKIKKISPESEKTGGYDAGLWEYRQVESPATGTRYWYYTTRTEETAPVIVCIHGLFLDGRTFVNLAPFMSGRRLVALNLPQQSKRYTGTMDDYATIVCDFIRTLTIDHCTLLGVSFGGMVALHTAAHRPGDLHFDRLVLAASGLPGVSRKARMQSRSMQRMMAGFTDYQLYWFIERVNRFTLRNYGKEYRTQFTKILDIKHPDWYRGVTAAVSGYNALADAQAITSPVLVLHAEADVFLEKKMRSLMRTAFPDGRYHTVEKSNHAMVFTMAETVAGYINDFLKVSC